MPTPALRRYQAAALQAFEATLASGQRRTSLVLPPGGGKTRLGLEAAAGIGQPALVLAPSVTVQAQWLAEAARFLPGKTASSARTLTADVCVLTYQSLAVVDVDSEAHDRRKALRSGSTAELLEQLHPRGRELIDRAAALAVDRGPWTVLLDECHHLLELWGGLLRAVVDTLGPETVVLGLTATPPSALTGWQAELQDTLFHGCAYAVATPALVKEGELAPYQELLFLTRPTEEETGWLETETARFASLTVELADVEAGGLSLLGWLQRVSARDSRAGVALPWRSFAAAEPELAQAAVRFAAAGLIPLPAGAAIAERDAAAPEAGDWATVLAGYAGDHLLAATDEKSVRLLFDIRHVLPGLGSTLTRTGARATTSPVDRLVALSGAKHAATAQILDAEWQVRGPALRSVVLTDFEAEASTVPASLREVGTLSGGSARAVLATLARATIDGQAGGLAPVLVTGRTFAASPEVAASLVRRGAASGLSLDTSPLEGFEGSLVVVGGDGFGPAAWTALATAHLIDGETHCLVGTRGLLGEGWDCPALNVLVDLTTATTATAVAQIRGRSLRRDPADPSKLASNWTVVCVAEGHPRGDADWRRAVRKHESLLALAPDGDIETGIGHCLPRTVTRPTEVPGAGLSLEVTAAALQCAADPASPRAAWRIGEPYAGAEAPTLRVLGSRDLGVPSALAPVRLQLGGELSLSPRRRERLPDVLLAVVAVIALAIAGSASVALAGVLLALMVIVGGSAAGRAARRRTRSLASAATSASEGAPPVLADVAAAVADGLRAAGLSRVGAEGLVMTRDPAGWVDVSLAGAAAEEFRTALDQVLAPVGEPRHLVARPVVALPGTAAGQRHLALAMTLGRSVPAVVVWHAVPTMFGRNKSALGAYLTAWSTRVCGGRPAQHLATATPEGRAVLDVVSGQDPFGMLAQMRTVWT